MACTNHYITAGNQDGHWSASLSDFNAANLYNYVFQSVFPVPTTLHSFLVYNPNIPVGSIVSNASLSFHSYANDISDFTWRIYGVKQPAPSIPLTSADCQNATLTTNFSEQVFIAPTNDWVINSWYAYNSNLNAVIQEIIDQPGYTIISNIILQIRYISPLSGLHGRQFTSFETSPLLAAILCIELQSPSTGKGSIRIRDEIYYASDIRDR